MKLGQLLPCLSRDVLHKAARDDNVPAGEKFILDFAQDFRVLEGRFRQQNSALVKRELRRRLHRNAQHAEPHLEMVFPAGIIRNVSRNAHRLSGAGENRIQLMELNAEGRHTVP